MATVPVTFAGLMTIADVAPTPPIYYPPPGVPTHPIAGAPVYPSHPIAGVPPGYYPTHPIVLPPSYPSHPIAGAPGVPTHPIELPPGTPPGQGGVVLPPAVGVPIEGSIVFVPGVGWVFVPASSPRPSHPIAGGPTTGAPEPPQPPAE